MEMKKIIAFGASNSKQSINKKFAAYVANKLENVEVQLLDLNDYDLPLYSSDLEVLSGVPAQAIAFKKLIENCDGLVISLAEHNGMVTAAFKNVWDWASREEMKIWQDKPMFLLSASPGGRGAANVLRTVKDLLPHFGGNVLADFSLPSFHENFSEAGIKDPELAQDLANKIEQFQENFG